jgi:hypothetical protein
MIRSRSEGPRLRPRQRMRRTHPDPSLLLSLDLDGLERGDATGALLRPVL